MSRELRPSVLSVSLVKTELPTVIKNEPAESEIVEIGIDDILDSSESEEEIIPNVKDLDIVYHPVYDASIKSEILQSKHCKSVETQVLIKAENSLFIKTENITQRNNTEDTSAKNVTKGTDQAVVEVQGSNQYSNVLSNLETDAQLVLNFSEDLNGISTRTRKAKHPEKTNFAKCYKTIETTSWEKDKEKINIIKAPVILVKPHEYISLAKDKHVCNYCQLACNRLKRLKYHIKQMHREVTTMYQCPYCPYKSKYRRYIINQHIILKHKDTKDIQWFQCNLCEMQFKLKNSLTQHMKDHLKRKQMQDGLDLSEKDHGQELSQRSDKQNGEDLQVTTCNALCKNQVLLATALVEVQDGNGLTHVCRVLLDSGSMSNFITSRLAEKLNILQNSVNVSISGIDQIQAHVSKSCNLQIKSRYSKYKTSIECLIIPRITDNLPTGSLDPSSFQIPSYIQLADPQFYESRSIDILIGAGVFWQLVCKGTRQLGKNKPFLQRSKLGWYISGTLGAGPELQQISCNFSKNTEVQTQLAKFWELDELPSRKLWSVEEQAAEQHFQKTFKRDSEGRFVVSIPLKDSISKLGNSREGAKGLFFSLEKRLASSPKLKEMYTDFMTEYGELKDMSHFESLETQTSFFSPHHGVLREESSTTKLRVVFNSSFPSSTGHSYNSLQMVGPTVQEDLLSILLRFRQHSYVISADICKMYRQIRISEEFKPLQQILWRSKPEQELQTFSLNTVVYGTASAPFLATRCLLQLSIDHQTSHPKASNVIKRDFYVDDLLSGGSSIEEVVEISQQISSILLGAGFELRKWKSNSSEILSKIKSSNHYPTDKFYFGSSETSKILGMLWSSQNDALSFLIKNNQPNARVTKRSMLSKTAQIFDPLGLLGPVVIRAKMFLQELWLLNLSWDEILPPELAGKWQRFRSELTTLYTLNIERHVTCKEPIRIELHGFSDASQHAYGACIYIRSVNVAGKVHVHLLASKTRVVPLKSVSIPRLELSAAVLLAQLYNKIVSALTINFDNIQFWCDSTVALSWIRSSPHLFQVFVGNRVSEIQTLTPVESWHYVSTDQNPADILSRGVSPKVFAETNDWFHGPLWLRQAPSQWPQDITLLNPISLQNLPEIRKNTQIFIETSNEVESEIFPFKRYSSFSKIKRIMAYCLRFINNCKTKFKDRNLKGLNLDELRNATNKLVILSQQESFPTDLKELRKCGVVNNQSRLLSLSPILINDVIRVGGRLKNSSYSFEKKHPILLSNKHRLTYLIVKDLHYTCFHCGPQLLLSRVRESYWPISGTNLAKQIVHECIVCFRFKPKFINPFMGNLPESRISPRSPFSDVGMDYAGPFQYRNKKGRGSKTLKCFLCLFICLTVKAIHLELVTDLSTAAFLEAFQRFISRRGKPLNVYSDNGSNFVGAHNQLKELRQFLKSSKENIIKELGIDLDITWHFIPAYSPHLGGIWESGIKSANQLLSKILTNSSSTLTFESFYTTITQIEGLLNSRPLTPLSADPNDLSALTPSHFLIGRVAVSIPYPDLESTPSNRLSLFEQIENLKQRFWKRWSGEYVSLLQRRQKWNRQSRNLSIGDMVLVHDNDLPPFKWRLGRVCATHPGSDGIVRVASVKTESGVIKRAVVKLAPLPLEQ